MKKAWVYLGRIAFWLSWPLLFVYLTIGRRTRVLIVFEDQIVVNQGWLSSGRWSLPGGGLHRREKPEIGAVREVQEETGLDISPAQLQDLGKFSTSWLGFRSNYLAFVVKLTKKSIVTPHRPEIVHCRWLEIKELDKTNATDDLLYFLARWQAGA